MTTTKTHDTGSALGADDRVHFARVEAEVALCGERLVESVDARVLTGGWIGEKTSTCIPCIGARLQETR